MKLAKDLIGSGTMVSPPTRGAWIEIVNQDYDFWSKAVAPHTGGVD